MITHLQGQLARMDAGGPLVEVDVSGVRYEVLVPLVLWPELQALAGDGELGNLLATRSCDPPSPLPSVSERRA